MEKSRIMEYKETLNLPRTEFPMRANLAQREPAMLARWEAMGLHRRMVENRKGRPTFVLHDGPPYANGHIHIGHALNKILKDMIVKYRTMAGSLSVYIPGWDCHGLPIEHQVDKTLGARRGRSRRGTSAASAVRSPRSSSTSSGRSSSASACWATGRTRTGR